MPTLLPTQLHVRLRAAARATSLDQACLPRALSPNEFLLDRQGGTSEQSAFLLLAEHCPRRRSPPPPPPVLQYLSRLMTEAGINLHSTAEMEIVRDIKVGRAQGRRRQQEEQGRRPTCLPLGPAQGVVGTGV